MVGSGSGELLGPLAGCRDRFVVDSDDFGGRIGLVEHLLAPHSIAAPMHRHTREDEFSMILEGTVWFSAGGGELTAGPGDLVVKPRGEWHTFWNADGRPARLLEVISPGGLEHAFRLIDSAEAEVDLDALLAPYGCEADMAATLPIVEKYQLVWG